jgi:OOP family OmpA-OmpF porin
MAKSSRITTSLATLLTLTAAGGLCWWGATHASGFVEQRARDHVQASLQAAGQDWVTVTTDGLQVRLSGTAPSEVDRFRAISQAAKAVDRTRIFDDMTVTKADSLTPPDFKVELLRNEDGISLIGLVPAKTDRDAMTRMLRDETAATQITDLLETADYPVPQNWPAALDYGLRAAQMAGSAKISIQPGFVTVTAITDSRAEKGRLEATLRLNLPAGLKLVSNISAPRPVIAPFTLRFVIDERGAHFDACAAEDEAGRDRILAAGTAAGVSGTASCTLGLGSPSPDWDKAAVAAVTAVAKLKAGTITISDADIVLHGPASLDQAQFDKVVTELEQKLPDVFSLRAQRDSDEKSDEGEALFTAALDKSHALNMQGRIMDARMREAVDSFARSRFANVEGNLRSDENVPAGWSVRVIGALEAMDMLHDGQVEVTPDLVKLSGTSGDPAATQRVAASLSNRIGAGAPYELTIRYDRWLDPGLNLPSGAECVGQLNVIMSESEIGFEPNKATIAGDPAPTLTRLSQAMTDCVEYQIEAGGHTDSQGSAAFNADLSRSRAQALVAAMTEAGIDTTNMSSRGYGESQPIASNEDEAGREENRRIEFRLLSESPVRNVPLPAPVKLQGVTSEVVPETRTPADSPVRQPVVIDPALMEGPPVPAVTLSPATPATVGASETFQTLDEREENARLPVQTPDADTPRPKLRPDDIAAAHADDEDGTESE